MALPSSIQDRERDKFVEDAAGDVAVRVALTNSAGSDAIVAEDAAMASGDAMMVVGGRRQDTPISDTTLDGDASFLKVSSIGALWVQHATTPGYEDDSRDRALTASPLVVTETYNATPYLFTGAAATANIKADAGVITSFQFRNSSASHLWIIFNDDANTITGADAAELSFYLAPTSSLVISSDFFPSKQHGFATGIAVGVSSTQATYTAYGTPSEVTGMVMYG